MNAKNIRISLWRRRYLKPRRLRHGNCLGGKGTRPGFYSDVHGTVRFVIPQKHYESPRLRPLLDLLHNERFQRAVAAMPGYDVTPMGTIVKT